MRRLTGSFLAAGLLATGGATAAALGLGIPAGADDTPDRPPGLEAPAPPDESGRLREALDGLVENGTITAAQADAVVGALQDAFPRVTRFAHHLDLAREALTAAAGVIGIDEAELRTALEDGQSLAEVAEANGVSREELLAGLTDAATERIDAAVAGGDLPDEMAAAMKERMAEVLDKVVDGSLDDLRLPFGRPFFQHERGSDEGGNGDDGNGPD